MVQVLVPLLPVSDVKYARILLVFLHVSVHYSNTCNLTGLHSAEDRGRSVSLFAPNSFVDAVHEQVYSVDMLDSYRTTPQLTSGTNMTTSTSYPLHFPSINTAHLPPVSIPLPPSPAIPTQTTEESTPTLALMTQSAETRPSMPSPTIRSRKDPRSSFPSVCPVMSKSSSQSSTSSESSMQSPIARARRAASPSRIPQMDLVSSSSRHTLTVQLPTEIKPEMVTISAKKGDRLAVVADAWHMEVDCE